MWKVPWCPLTFRSTDRQIGPHLPRRSGCALLRWMGIEQRQQNTLAIALDIGVCAGSVHKRSQSGTSDSLVGGMDMATALGRFFCVIVILIRANRHISIMYVWECHVHRNLFLTAVLSYRSWRGATLQLVVVSTRFCSCIPDWGSLLSNKTIFVYGYSKHEYCFKIS